MRAIGAQNLLTMPGGVSTSGYLHKKGGSQFSLLKWPLRYIIIHKGCVYYFKSSTSASPQGAFSLNGYNRVMRAAEETTSSNVFPFKIVHFSKKHRTWYFSAASEDERRKWMRYLRREIDHYNDRKEAHIASDSDSDADFYGTIERPLEIKHPVDTAEDDYVDDEDDDEEDEEDYLKPDGDGSPTTAGRPTGPPPSYPPPPVPAVPQLRRDSSPNIQKGPPPPPPGQHRNTLSPLPKKPSIPHQSLQKEPSKGPAPPLPFAPHLQKAPSPTPPAIPPSSMKTSQGKATSGNDRRDWTPPSALRIPSPATLPICEQLQTRMVLNGPVHGSSNTGSTQSLGNHCLRRPCKPPPQTEGSPLSANPTPFMPPSLPVKPPSSLLLKPGPNNKPTIPTPYPPTSKPSLPSSEKPRSPFQRASPDGQSFREEVPTDSRRKPKSSKHGSDSDDDYENVQLPDSVFIDSTETSFVERLFKECCANPPDGLYGIRNSGTKTAKVLVVWDVGIKKARNYRLFEEDDSVFLESDVAFPHLAALIEHYYSHPLPHHGSLCLQKPYAKNLSS